MQYIRMGLTTLLSLCLSVATVAYSEPSVIANGSVTTETSQPSTETDPLWLEKDDWLA
jgi:hypothetical protein